MLKLKTTFCIANQHALTTLYFYSPISGNIVKIKCVCSKKISYLLRALDGFYDVIQIWCLRSYPASPETFSYHHFQKKTEQQCSLRSRLNIRSQRFRREVEGSRLAPKAGPSFKSTLLAFLEIPSQSLSVYLQGGIRLKKPTSTGPCSIGPAKNFSGAWSSLGV